MFDPIKLHKDFPLLRETGKKTPIYFDNACSTLKPQSVIDSINQYYREYPVCGGRSNYRLADMVTKKVEESRVAAAKFINAKKPNEIIFLKNTTEGINLVARGLGLKQGDVVLTSDKEHNSNLIPWQILSENIGVIHETIPSAPDNTFDLEALKTRLNKKVKLVAIGTTSNLDGVSVPLADIVKLAHKNGSLVLADAAQTIPHHPMDVQALGVDFMAFSGHKMLGPSGTGILYGKYDLFENLEPLMTGGGTVEYSTYTKHALLPTPAKFEAGLQDYAGIIALKEAFDYLKDVGFKNITHQETLMNQTITDALKNIPGLTVIGPQDPVKRGGILSFYVDGVDTHQLSLMLDARANIMIRSGRHCVHSWFEAHDVHSSARLSFYFYNTLEEAEKFIKVFKEILTLF